MQLCAGRGARLGVFSLWSHAWLQPPYGWAEHGCPQLTVSFTASPQSYCGDLVSLQRGRATNPCGSFLVLPSGCRSPDEWLCSLGTAAMAGRGEWLMVAEHWHQGPLCWALCEHNGLISEHNMRSAQPSWACVARIAQESCTPGVPTLV